MIIRCKTSGLAYGISMVPGGLREVQGHIGHRLIKDGLATQATVQEYVQQQLEGSRFDQREKRVVKAKTIRASGDCQSDNSTAAT